MNTTIGAGVHMSRLPKCVNTSSTLTHERCTQPKLLFCDFWRISAIQEHNECVAQIWLDMLRHILNIDMSFFNFCTYLDISRYGRTWTYPQCAEHIWICLDMTGCCFSKHILDIGHGHGFHPTFCWRILKIALCPW